MNEKDMWLCMLYNNRGVGIAPKYWDRFAKFCEQNGLTDEPPIGQRVDGKDKWFEHFGVEE
jgi:hypothetical protein